MAVEGHRRDPELLGDASQADRLEAFGGADADRMGDDGLPGQTGPSERPSGLVGSCAVHRLTSLRRIPRLRDEVYTVC